MLSTSSREWVRTKSEASPPCPRVTMSFSVVWRRTVKWRNNDHTGAHTTTWIVLHHTNNIPHIFCTQPCQVPQVVWSNILFFSSIKAVGWTKILFVILLCNDHHLLQKLFFYSLKVNMLMFKAFSYIINPSAIEANVENPSVTSEKVFSSFFLFFFQTLFWYHADMYASPCCHPDIIQMSSRFLQLSSMII